MKAKRVGLETKRQVEFARNLLATNFARVAYRIIYAIFSCYTDNCIARSNVICQFYTLAGSRSISIFGFRQHNLSLATKQVPLFERRRKDVDWYYFLSSRSIIRKNFCIYERTRHDLHLQTCFTHSRERIAVVIGSFIGQFLKLRISYNINICINGHKIEILG